MTERGNMEGVGGWRGVCMCVWKEGGGGGMAALRCNYNDALHMIKKTTYDNSGSPYGGYMKMSRHTT